MQVRQDEQKQYTSYVRDSKWQSEASDKPQDWGKQVAEWSQWQATRLGKASGRVKPVTSHKTGASKWHSEASDKPQDWGKQVAEWSQWQATRLGQASGRVKPARRQRTSRVVSSEALQREGGCIVSVIKQLELHWLSISLSFIGLLFRYRYQSSTLPAVPM